MFTFLQVKQRTYTLHHPNKLIEIRSSNENGWVEFTSEFHFFGLTSKHFNRHVHWSLTMIMLIPFVLWVLTWTISIRLQEQYSSCWINSINENGLVKAPALVVRIVKIYRPIYEFQSILYSEWKTRLNSFEMWNYVFFIVER